MSALICTLRNAQNGDKVLQALSVPSPLTTQAGFALHCKSQPQTIDLMQNNRLDILLIENDPAMAHLTKEAFRDAGMLEQIVCLPNGDEALAYLRREKHYEGEPYPDLIFLDLHLPRKSGLEVLSEMKANPKLSTIPVVVISGSADPREVKRAYELHASCYVRKPNDLDEFLRFIQICFLFWGTVVALPEKPDYSTVARSSCS